MSQKHSTGTVPVSVAKRPREVLQPGFFRDGARRLYACHHLARRGAAVGPCVLMCNATGHEYERGHRAFRQLAAQLAIAGHHVMRFDYIGTGDSAGDYAQASLADWEADIADAIDACRAAANQNAVCLVGLRLGATLALNAAARRDDVESMVFWDPIVDGAALLAEWDGLQAGRKRQATSTLQPGEGQEVLGYPLTAGVRAELSKLTLPDAAGGLRRGLLLPEDTAREGIAWLAGLLRGHGTQVTLEAAEAAAVWRKEPMEAIVPFKLLLRIVSWLGESRL